MDWRERFLIRFGPSVLSGVTLPVWLRILRENRYAIDLPYWIRAAIITSGSLTNSALAWCESLINRNAIRAAHVDPPLFILGIWRSGTTHLHNLLAQDNRFAFPTTYEVSWPHTFLLMEQSHAKSVARMLPETRAQDNMKLGVEEPQEDEFAFCSITGRSFMLSWAFPRNADHYERLITLRDASPDEVAEWKRTMAWLVQKLSLKHKRPLVLKSPGHTARIRLLLELFPNAKFVHIHRNPYEVYQSTVYTVRKVVPWLALQRPDYRDLEERTIRNYRRVFDAFFDERSLIPKERFHEVSYEALERDPIGVVRGVYEGLALPDFNEVEPALRTYVESVSNYKKNTFSALASDVRTRIAGEWRRCFEEWGYAM
jgi:hypothetical protein